MIASPSSRNDPCPCGSGMRYKHCHGRVDAVPPAAPSRPRNCLWTMIPIAPKPTWRRVLERVPGDPEASFHLGNIARARGRPRRGRRVVRNGAPAARRTMAACSTTSVSRWKRRGRIDGAEPVFRQAAGGSAGCVRAARAISPRISTSKSALPRRCRYFDALVARFPARARGDLGEPQRRACRRRAGSRRRKPGFRQALAQAPDTASLQRDLGLNCIRLQRLRGRGRRTRARRRARRRRHARAEHAAVRRDE